MGTRHQYFSKISQVIRLRRSSTRTRILVRFLCFRTVMTESKALYCLARERHFQSPASVHRLTGRPLLKSFLKTTHSVSSLTDGGTSTKILPKSLHFEEPSQLRSHNVKENERKTDFLKTLE